MGIFEFIKRDAKKIVSDPEGFTKLVTFVSPTGIEVDVEVLYTRHHLGFDMEKAQEINTLKAHVCVVETDLMHEYYPVRNSKNEVDLENHRIRATDVNGVNIIYVINQWFPNDVTGTISLILGAHRQ